jgi:hypothetical protein
MSGWTCRYNSAELRAIGNRHTLLWLYLTAACASSDALAGPKPALTDATTGGALSDTVLDVCLAAMSAMSTRMLTSTSLADGNVFMPPCPLDSAAAATRLTIVQIYFGRRLSDPLQQALACMAPGQSAERQNGQEQLSVAEVFKKMAAGVTRPMVELLDAILTRDETSWVDVASTEQVDYVLAAITDENCKQLWEVVAAKAGKMVATAAIGNNGTDHVRSSANTLWRVIVRQLLWARRLRTDRAAYEASTIECLRCVPFSTTEPSSIQTVGARSREAAQWFEAALDPQAKCRFDDYCMRLCENGLVHVKDFETSIFARLLRAIIDNQSPQLLLLLNVPENDVGSGRVRRAVARLGLNDPPAPGRTWRQVPPAQMQLGLGVVKCKQDLQEYLQDALNGKGPVFEAVNNAVHTGSVLVCLGIVGSMAEMRRSLEDLTGGEVEGVVVVSIAKLLSNLLLAPPAFKGIVPHSLLAIRGHEWVREQLLSNHRDPAKFDEMRFRSLLPQAGQPDSHPGCTLIEQFPYANKHTIFADVPWLSVHYTNAMVCLCVCFLPILLLFYLS